MSNFFGKLSNKMDDVTSQYSNITEKLNDVKKNTGEAWRNAQGFLKNAENAARSIEELKNTVTSSSAVHGGGGFEDITSIIMRHESDNIKKWSVGILCVILILLTWIFYGVGYMNMTSAIVNTVFAFIIFAIVIFAP